MKVFETVKSYNIAWHSTGPAIIILTSKTHIEEQGKQNYILFFKKIIAMVKLYKSCILTLISKTHIEVRRTRKQRFRFAFMKLIAMVIPYVYFDFDFEFVTYAGLEIYKM